MLYEIKDNILEIEIASLFYETVQDFLDAFIPSKKIQHLLIQNKWLTLDGNSCKRESELVGLKLCINLYPENHQYREVSNKPDIVYEDELFVVVNKPKDLLVHSDSSDEITLTEMVKGYYGNTNYDIQSLHRLDKETSGLVVFSKSSIFQPLLDKMMQNKEIRRNYLAFVAGKIKRNESFIIDKPIGKDRHHANKRVIYKNGQRALTKVKSLGYSKKNYTVLRCVLDTGRTHQIRVHLSSEGYPILNDPLYGVRSDFCIRMGLMAYELEFFHPLKEEYLKIEAPLPNDLAYLYYEVVDDEI